MRDAELARARTSREDFVVIGQVWQLHLDAPAATDAGRAQVARLAALRQFERPGHRFLVIGAQVRPTQCGFDQIRMLPGPLWHAPPEPCAPVARAEVADADAIDAALALRDIPNALLLRPSEIFCDAGHFTTRRHPADGGRVLVLVGLLVMVSVTSTLWPGG